MLVKAEVAAGARAAGWRGAGSAGEEARRWEQAVRRTAMSGTPLDEPYTGRENCTFHYKSDRVTLKVRHIITLGWSVRLALAGGGLGGVVSHHILAFPAHSCLASQLSRAPAPQIHNNGHRASTKMKRMVSVWPPPERMG